MICLKYLCAQQEHLPWYTKYYMSLYYRHPTSSSTKGGIIQWLDKKDIAYPHGALRLIFPHKTRFSRGRRPRPCWISVKTIYWSGDLQERFFLFDPSLTSGMSAALMQGHCIRRRPCIKQHMSGCREFHRKYHRQLPPHLTRRYMRQVGLMLSQCRRQWANIRLAFGWKIYEYSISKSSSLPQ